MTNNFVTNQKLKNLVKEMNLILKFCYVPDYQNCERCDGFVKCSNGHLYNIDCAPSKCESNQLVQS